MKKALLYCGIALLTAVLPGCKEMKDDIDTLKRPYPTGITLLQSEITVLNGSTLKVPFRVNPSNYIVQAEDLRLDAHPVRRSPKPRTSRPFPNVRWSA